MLPVIKTHKVKGTWYNSFGDACASWLITKVKEKLALTTIPYTLTIDTGSRLEISMGGQTFLIESFSYGNYNDPWYDYGGFRVNPFGGGDYSTSMRGVERRGNEFEFTFHYFETEDCFCLVNVTKFDSLDVPGHSNSANNIIFLVANDRTIPVIVNGKNTISSEKFKNLGHSWTDVPTNGLMDKIQFWSAQFSILNHPRLFRIKTGIYPFPYHGHNIFQTTSMGTFIVLESTRSNEGIIHALVCKLY